MALFLLQHAFRYEITRMIAEGGMGIVYEAEQLGSHGFRKRVAMKVIRSQYASQPSFVENFIGEAKLVADLIHTNIVQTYEKLGLYVRELFGQHVPRDPAEHGRGATLVVARAG